MGLLLPLLDALVKGALLLGLAAVLVGLLRRRSAAARHAVWTAALLAQLVLPTFSLALPAWNLPVLPYLTQTLGVPVYDVSSPQPGPRDGAASPVIPSVQLDALDPRGGESKSEIGARAGIILLALWAIGCVIMLARLAFGVTTVARLARRAERVTDEQWLSLVRQVAAALRIRRPVGLLRSERLPVPVTWGTVYPTVLLTHDADEWTTERRRFVLTHELAHVKRYDALTQVMAQVTAAIYWMNPLVWLAVHRMSIERERACDDYVLRGGAVASTYAQELLDIVRALNTAVGPALTTLALTGCADFEGRLLAILNPQAKRSAMDRRGVIAIAVLAVLLVIPLAALRPVARVVTHDEKESMATTQVASLHVHEPARIKLLVKLPPARSRRSSAVPGDTATESAAPVRNTTEAPTLYYYVSCSLPNEQAAPQNTATTPAYSMSVAENTPCDILDKSAMARIDSIALSGRHLTVVVRRQADMWTVSSVDAPIAPNSSTTSIDRSAATVIHNDEPRTPESLATRFLVGADTVPHLQHLQSGPNDRPLRHVVSCLDEFYRSLTRMINQRTTANRARTSTI